MSHDGQHGDDCFGCKIKTVQLSPSSTPSRRNSIPPKTNPDSNAWERGIARDSRGMPVLDENLQPMGLKEYAHKKRAVEDGRRKSQYTADTAKE